MRTLDGVVGTVVESPEWGDPTMIHVVWDGDDYMCVLRPEEVVIDDPPSN